MLPVELGQTPEGAVIVEDGIALIVTLVPWPPALAQPTDDVTTQFNVTEPEAPAVNVTVEPVWPAVIVPPVIDHEYVAPDVVATDAVLPVEFAHTDDGAVIVCDGVTQSVVAFALADAE